MKLIKAIVKATNVESSPNMSTVHPSLRMHVKDRKVRSIQLVPTKDSLNKFFIYHQECMLRIGRSLISPRRRFLNQFFLTLPSDTAIQDITVLLDDQNGCGQHSGELKDPIVVFTRNS